jgi:hypothetical protein
MSLVGTAMKTLIMANFKGKGVGEIVLYAFTWLYSLGDCTDSLYAALFSGECACKAPAYLLVGIALQCSERSVLRLPSQIRNDPRRIPYFSFITFHQQHKESSEHRDGEAG